MEYTSCCLLHQSPSCFTRWATAYHETTPIAWVPVTVTKENGFTLIEMIGVLAIMATLTAIILPNVIDQLDRAAQEAEAQNLRAIGQGIDTYLQQNRDWPTNWGPLSFEYVPFGDDQLTENVRAFPRYFGEHPNLNGFNNGNGLDPTNLKDLRFMVLSDLTQDPGPNLNNLAEFNTWWDTDDSITPDLIIYRGKVKKHFHLVSMSAVGPGGSYQIDGEPTNAGGSGTLGVYGNYHITGSLIELSEDNSFGSGSGVTISFSLTTNVGYQWDPNCTAGAKWHVLGTKCS